MKTPTVLTDEELRNAIKVLSSRVYLGLSKTHSNRLTDLRYEADRRGLNRKKEHAR